MNLTGGFRNSTVEGSVAQKPRTKREVVGSWRPRNAATPSYQASLAPWQAPQGVENPVNLTTYLTT